MGWGIVRMVGVREVTKMGSGVGGFDRHLEGMLMKGLASRRRVRGAEGEGHRGKM